MNKFANIILVFICVTYSVYCDDVYSTKQKFSPRIYVEKPVCIAILPAENNSKHPDAHKLFPTTINEALSEMGYYTMPYSSMNMICKELNLRSGKKISKEDANILKNKYGIDAVMHVDISNCSQEEGYLTASTILRVKFWLQSTRSKKTLWKDHMIQSFTQSTTTGSWILDLMPMKISYFHLAFIQCSKFLTESSFSTLPYGKRHELYQTDQDEEILISIIRRRKATHR